MGWGLLALLVINEGDMKFIFYGTAPGMPVISKRHSCVRVTLGKLNFIIDCGEGTTQAFLEHNDDVNDLDLIFLTHWHPDHSSGIFILLQMMAMKKRTKTLHLFIPENKTDFYRTLELFYLFHQKLSFKLELKYCDEIENTFPEISHFYTDHLYGNTEAVASYNLKNECLSFGVKIKSNDRVLIYTSDIVSFTSIQEYLSDCDFCITDGIHPSLDEFQELNKVIKDQILLTHGLGEGVEEMVKKNNKFKIVNDGEEFVILENGKIVCVKPH